MYRIDKIRDGEGVTFHHPITARDMLVPTQGEWLEASTSSEPFRFKPRHEAQVPMLLSLSFKRMSCALAMAESRSFNQKRLDDDDGVAFNWIVLASL